jgi:nitrogenase molybdenum-iron protein alpha chain
VQPELYFSRHPGSSVWAAKLGITAVPVIDEYTAFGHRGLVNFGYRIIDNLTNRNFVTRLAEQVKKSVDIRAGTV